MAKPSKDSISVTARIFGALVVEIDSMVKQRNQEKPGQTYTRTDAINEILTEGIKSIKNPHALEAGIIVVRHIHKLQDPRWVAEMKAHLEEVTLVDFVHNLRNASKDQFDSLAAVVFDELRLAAGKTPFSLLSPAEKKALLEK